MYYDEDRKPITDGQILQYAFRSEFFEHILTGGLSVLEKWVKALKIDESLRRSAISYIKQWLFRNQYNLHLAEEILEVLKGSKQSLDLDKVYAKTKQKREEEGQNQHEVLRNINKNSDLNCLREQTLIIHNQCAYSTITF